MAATGIKDDTPGTPDPGNWGKLKEGAVAVPPWVGPDAPVAGFGKGPRRIRWWL
jgi:hypothetical protein